MKNRNSGLGPGIVLTPQQPYQPYQPYQPQPSVQPMPTFIPAQRPTTPGVQYQLMPVNMTPGVPQIVVAPDPWANFGGIGGKLGRLGKVFGGK